MSHIKTLVERATSTDNNKPLKVGSYKAESREGSNCFVIDFSQNDTHFATFTIDKDLLVVGILGREPQSTVQMYKSISKGAEFLLALKIDYPNVKITKEYE